MKFLILIALSLCFSFADAQADSVLAKLPFGIVPGKTQLSDVASRGTCIQHVPRNDGQRCQVIRAQSGNFYVIFSENDAVMEVRFTTDSRLPQTWINAGIKFYIFPTGNQAMVKGTSIPELLKIIPLNGGVNITVAQTPYSADAHHVEFDVNELHYRLTVAEAGLIYIEVTEAY